MPHRTPWPRVGLVALAVSLLVALVVLAFGWPSVTSEARDLPVAITGPDALVTAAEQALDAQAPDLLALEPVADREAAVDAIETRQVYGALVLGPSPEVLTATAASPAAAQLLGQLATRLQAQLQQAAAAQAAAAGSPVTPQITVTVTDVVPTVAADPRGTGLVAASLPLVLGGMIGGIVVSIAIVGALRRTVGILLYSALGGLAVVAVLQGWFRVVDGPFGLEWLAVSLAILAIGAPIVGLASLIGRPGIALGPVLFLLFANPISGVTQPVEFYPAPWGDVGQWFPPGAGATLLRDVAYFPRADAAMPWLVLASWAIVGLVLGVVGHFRTAPVVEAPAAGDPVSSAG